MDKRTVTIIGGGPAGLIAAEILAEHGFNVSIYDRKPSIGRKFLIAGRGGLNLTHSENQEDFGKRYNKEAQEFISPLLNEFSSHDLRNWCHALGVDTFVGTSGRIFPKSFKASPLLRAWIQKLENLGVKFKTQKNWSGWDKNKNLIFINASGGTEILASDITLLALGGASWPNLGSDGAWVSVLKEQGIEVNTLRPANCGFNVEWSDIFRSKFSGQPLKNIGLSFEGRVILGEMMISSQGIEGGAVYALSSRLRQHLDEGQETILKIDLKPSLTSSDIRNRLDHTSRKKNSFSAYLEKTLGLNPVSIGLLREASLNVQNFTNEDLAKLIKALPLKIKSPFDIEKAISSAGGISLSSIDKNMMLKKIPGIFVAGEMLDWEAPTGGYLLQACFSTGVAAAKGILNYANKSG